MHHASTRLKTLFPRYVYNTHSLLLPFYRVFFLSFFNLDFWQTFLPDLAPCFLSGSCTNPYASHLHTVFFLPLVFLFGSPIPPLF